MCSALGCRPDFSGLYAWARWVTPEAEKYRYDTHFFLIPLSPTQRDHAKIDGENLPFDGLGRALDLLMADTVAWQTSR